MQTEGRPIYVREAVIQRAVTLVANLHWPYVTSHLRVHVKIFIF